VDILREEKMKNALDELNYEKALAASRARQKQKKTPPAPRTFNFKFYANAGILTRAYVRRLLDDFVDYINDRGGTACFTIESSGLFSNLFYCRGMNVDERLFDYVKAFTDVYSH
jgi:hypothetical protein